MKTVERYKFMWPRFQMTQMCQGGTLLTLEVEIPYIVLPFEAKTKIAQLYGFFYCRCWLPDLLIKDGEV